MMKGFVKIDLVNSSFKENIHKVPEQYPRDSHEVSLHADPVYPM